MNDPIIAMLKGSPVGDTVRRYLSDPKLRSQIFDALDVDEQTKGVLMQALGKNDKPAKPPEPKKPTEAEYVGMLKAMGLPDMQARIAVMIDAGKTPLDIAVSLNGKYPEIRFTPKLVQFFFAEEIGPEIQRLTERDVLSSGVNQTSATKTTPVSAPVTK